jgi:large subunit ribosomal protein L16
MLLAPSRTKYRRQHRGRMKGEAHRGATLAFGEFGLQALEPCWMEARQIEAARIALTRFMKRGGKVWIRVFPDKPISAKPAETRMGSGKGAVDHWVAVIKPGRIIFEVGGVSEEIAREAVRLAGHKLPIRTRFVKREEAESVEA